MTATAEQVHDFTDELSEMVKITIVLTVFLLLLMCLLLVGITLSIAKICSTSPGSASCQLIGRSQEVACNGNQHGVDCLLNIQKNETHLGKITGDEALLAAGVDLSEDVVVLGKITSHHPPSETVVIVNNDIAWNFVSLEGKTLCHPGYNHDSTFSYFMLQELENKIIESKSPNCDNITLLERHIKQLSEFFGPSCRPGPWTQNDKFDKTLKTKYSSLCKLCTNEHCNENYPQPFNDSLKCLLRKNADVAVTTLQEAQLFFQNVANSNRYKYMCKDGSVKSSSTPCSWTKTLPDLVVAHRSVVGQMKNFLQKNLGSHINYNLTLTRDTSNNKYEEPLVDLLELQQRKITFLENNGDFLSLKKFVNDYTTVPNPETSKQCDRTLRWCTYSDLETKKCKWLRQAAVNWGIQPVVECVQSEGDDELSCLDDLKKGSADIVVASSNYAYISLKKELTSIAFPETDTRYLSQIFVVKRADDSSIKSFSDLKGKSACIPQFGGKEHLSLIDTTRRLGITDDTQCDYGKLLNDFIGDSCVPGVRSSLIKDSTDLVDKDKMCRRCKAINQTKTAEYCNADVINAYFASQGAVNCLLNNDGDFAVVSKKDVLNDTSLTALCKNDSLASMNGLLNVNTDCALFVLASSEVVLKNDSSKKSDIQLALYEFEKWFGQKLRKPFHLFDKFDNEPDLLFLDSTPGLNFEGNLPYMEEYQRLLNNVLDCNTSGSASVISSMSFIISFVLLTLCFTF
ncbi:Transferrin-like Protein [Tribolium castaneum]|uniref:Transferrin-like Protein n=2 Tax=Tribolium castaneum TaxID=7070 RepID=A0A139WNP6_TRICA|nr:Transferrin-like Protein [Tribolium castaneum]